MIDINMKLKEKFPRLYEAALKEFSCSSYESSSLNQILKDAGMSKGSFYHNIGDKYSLYLMLLGCITSTKLSIWKENQSIPDTDFFNKLKTFCIKNFNFIIVEPYLFKLFIQLNKETPEFIAKIHGNYNKDDKKIWFDTINDGINSGDIRQDISYDVICAFIDSVIKGITNLILALNTSEKENNLQEIQTYVVQYIDLLKDALAVKKEKK